MLQLRRCLTLIVAIQLGLFVQSSALAQTDPLSHSFSPGEWALLPDYCINTQAGREGPDSPAGRHWMAIIGPDFIHLHHYCYALRDMQRAQTNASVRTQKMLYERARGDIGYVINNSQPTMPLMPEVLLKLGIVELKLGNLPGAQQAFERARALKPDYWPAYTHWIDVLMSLKQSGTARALTEEGLRYAPENPELRKRAVALGVSIKSVAKAAAAASAN